MTQNKEYKAWHNMKTRCYNENFPDYKYWGGRGITVCERWEHSFENFYQDMGQCPNGHTLHRPNNDGNYEPGNCQWVTWAEQNGNRRSNVLKQRRYSKLMALMLGDTEREIVKWVADTDCDGNKSQAVRRIIREYAKDRDLPIPDAQLASVQSAAKAVGIQG